MAGRREFVRTAAAIAAFACAGAVRAQDGRTSSVQTAARDWVQLTDKGALAATWDAAGRQFQAAIPRERWIETLTAVRTPFGSMTQRSVLSTNFMKSIAGAPDGDYAMVLFRTSFANRQDSRETVTLEREADGVWRVVGYVIQ